MGLCERITDELGIEWRRTSVRIFDEDEAPSQQIFGNHSSVEFGAAQLLRLLDHFNGHPEQVEKLRRMAEQEQREESVGS